MLNEFYAAMIAKGLSSRMARYAHTLVRKALADAVVWNRVARNVAAAAKPPRLTSPEIECWSRDDLRAFLDAAREDRLFPALLLAATTGMRRGELLGLKWNAIDFERSRIAVIRTLVLVGEEAVESEPKTAAGKRSIPIDPRTLATLQEWRKRQIEDRLKAGPRWKDSGYVFTEPEDGRPIHPRSFTKHFARLVRRVGVRPISVHGLRHTFITLALGAGVPVKVVSEIVGHSDPGFTLRKYAHAIPALQEDATSRVAGLILGGQA
jgi:integrase